MEKVGNQDRLKKKKYCLFSLKSQLKWGGRGF